MTERRVSNYISFSREFQYHATIKRYSRYALLGHSVVQPFETRPPSRTERQLRVPVTTPQATPAQPTLRQSEARAS